MIVMTNWYWYKESDKELRGPVNGETLEAKVDSGELERQDKVWKDGYDGWVRASSISGLFPVPPPIDNAHQLSRAARCDDSPGRFDDSQRTSPEEQTQSQELTRSPFPPTSKGTDYKSDARSSGDTAYPNEEESTSPELQGVGGWLTFFCVALTILGPLISLSQMATNWEVAQPAFDLLPILESAVWIENVGVSAIVIYGFVVGVYIWQGHENGKAMAKRYLIIRLLAFVLLEVLVMGMLSGLPGEVYSVLAEELIAALFREGIFFGVWFTYFKLSKRVANTYG